MPYFGPWALLGLLYTIIILFASQVRGDAGSTRLMGARIPAHPPVTSGGMQPTAQPVVLPPRCPGPTLNLSALRLPLHPPKGKLIINQLGNVARVSVPMLLSFLIMFTLSLVVAWYTRMTYSYAAMQAFTASSNK